MPYTHHLGIDLHKEFGYWTLMNDEKQVLFKGKVVTKEESVKKAVASLGVPPESVQCAIEPVSQWGWYSDILADQGLHVKLVDVYKSKLIAGTKLKNDKVDSRILAELLRSNFLPEAYLAPKETRELRELLRWRIFLTRIRARLKNRLTAMVFHHGLICPKADMFGKSGRVWLEEQKLSPLHSEERQSLLRVFDSITPEIDKASTFIKEKAEADETTKILMTIPGIGAFTAMVMMAEIGTFERFPSPEKLSCFAGLIASSYSSGGKLRFGRITKRGSPHLRWAMIEATNTVRPSWGHLYDFYSRIKVKKGGKVARVALARKMLSIAWILVKKKEPFQARVLESGSFRQREAVIS
jgi:transposase